MSPSDMSDTDIIQDRVVIVKKSPGRIDLVRNQVSAGLKARLASDVVSEKVPGTFKVPGTYLVATAVLAEPCEGS